MTPRPLSRIVSTLSLALLLAGCGQGSRIGKTTVAPTGLSGVVHGGQNPVSGAMIQLYTVGTTADGSTATPLLTKTVASLGDGNFDITGLYSCSSASEVYLTATGGDPDPGTPNANLALMVALGPCASVASMSFIEVNELTTVAAVNALAPFMKSYTAVGSGTSDVAALDAAFTLADEFVDPSTGTAPGIGVPSGYVVPLEEIDTLGDIAASCINSAGGVSGQNNACGNLFKDTTPTNGSVPADTIAALLSLANNPSLNTSLLFQLSSTEPPFEPTLTATPANFSVALQPASLTVSPSEVVFSATPVGSTSETETITIHNGGSTQQPLAGISLGGANATDFTETNNCPATLPSTATCTVQLTAVPSAAGTRTGTLIVSSSQAFSAQTISLTVTASAGTGITVSPSSLSFPFTAIATASQPQEVTFKNVSGSTVTSLSIALTGAGTSSYSITQTCGTSLASGVSCTVSVTFTPQVDGTIPATLQLTGSGGASVPVSLSGTCGDPTEIAPDANTYVFNTTEGNIYVELRPDVAPKNVANFLYYVNNGTYTNSIIHRVVAGFIDQGGGYTLNGDGQIVAPPTTTAVVNEFNLSNVRGTLAMAKLSNDPNSATDQFFFNTADNSATLNTQDGGYTVIASIVGIQGANVGSASAGLAVMDAINAVPVYAFQAPFDSIPLLNYTDGATVDPSNYVYVNSISQYTAQTNGPATPLFSETTGTYAGPQTLTLTDSTPNATIYYYLFGGTAQTATVYTGPFTVSTSQYVVAYATAPGYSSDSYYNYEYYDIESSNVSKSSPSTSPKKR